jgi:hypothetical protein
LQLTAFERTPVVTGEGVRVRELSVGALASEIRTCSACRYSVFVLLSRNCGCLLCRILVDCCSEDLLAVSKIEGKEVGLESELAMLKGLV